MSSLLAHFHVFLTTTDMFYVYRRNIKKNMERTNFADLMRLRL